MKRLFALGWPVVVIGAMGCSSPRHPDPEPVPPPPRAERPAKPQGAETPQPPPPEVTRAPKPVSNPREDETGVATPDETQPLNTTREELAELVAYYRLDAVTVAVSSGEDLGAYGMGDTLAQQFREAFSELGMRVVAAPEPTPGGAKEIRALAAGCDADLVAVILGRAKERARLQNFLSYEAMVRATVYESGGEIVATKEIQKTGERSTDAEKAARTALRAASDNLGPFLVEQIVRKVGQNVASRRLTVEGMPHHASVARLIAHLKRQPGINDVRLLSWDEKGCVARMIVYLQPAALDNLGAYLASVPDLDVRIREMDRKRIEAGNKRSGS